MIALRRHKYFLNIHAGVVRGPAGCIMLPAPPGSGKSTLTAALVRAGLDYFSDEVALLDEAELQVTPFPQALCVKQSGIPAIAPLFPEITGLALHARADGKHVAYLPPPRARMPNPETRGQVRGLVFPRYQAGAPVTSTPLPKAAALGRLLDQCTVIDRRLGHADVQRLVTWIDGIASREITYGRTEDGVAAVFELLDEMQG
jgi:hypothetical protein